MTKLPLMLKEAEMSQAPHPLDPGQSLERNLFLRARRLEREGKITDGWPSLPATHGRRPPGEVRPPVTAALGWG